MAQIAGLIREVVARPDDGQTAASVREEVAALAAGFPLP